MSDELFSESKEIEIKNNSIIDYAKDSNDTLIMMAIDKNLDIDKLKELIALKNQEEERQAKRDFDFHFAEMQKEFVPVKREKQGYEFKYAPVELLQTTYGPVISKHGFSYRWREENIETGKRCILTISGWGHSESNYFDIPFLEETKRMNKVQVSGAMSTYGRRYTFISGFGIIIEDEDDIDNLSVYDGADYADDIKKIDECKTVEELVKVWRGVWELSDARGRKVLTPIYDKRKKELQGAKK